jgi:hypothetical protein
VNGQEFFKIPKPLSILTKLHNNITENNGIDYTITNSLVEQWLPGIVKVVDINQYRISVSK